MSQFRLIGSLSGFSSHSGKLLLFPLLILLLISSRLCLAQAPDNRKNLLTDTEITWLADHPVIRISMDPLFEPLIIQAPDGSITGIYKKIYDDINTILGTNIQIVIEDWPTAVANARSRKTDGLLTAAISQANASKLLSTQIIHYELPMVYIRQDKDLLISSIKDLENLRIAHQKSFQCMEELLKPYSQYQQVYQVNNSLEAFKLLSEDKIDAFVAQNYEQYMMSKNLITNIKVAYTDIENPTPVVTAIRDDWPELVTIIDKGLNAIGRNRINEYFNMWLTNYQSLFDLEITELEEGWIIDHPVISVALPENDPPYSFTDSSGKPKGLLVDYLTLLSEYVDIKFDPDLISSGQLCKDLTAASIDLALIDEAMVSSASMQDIVPLLEIQYAMVTSGDELIVNGSQWLNSKTVCVLSSDPVADFIANDMMHITVVKADSMSNALNMVANKRCHAFIGDITSISYDFIKARRIGLKVTALNDFDTSDICFVANGCSPELVSILNKIVNRIQPQQQDAILSRWLTVNVENKTGWQDILKFTALILIIPLSALTIVIVWNRQLNRAVNSRTAELEQEKAFNDSTFKTLQEMILIYDPVAYINVRWNRAFSQVFGYDDEEIRNLPMPAGFFNDPKQVAIACDNLKNTVENGESYCELNICTKYGQTIPYEFTSSRMNDLNGDLQYIVIVGRNISTRKESENKLEQYRLHLEELVKERTEQLNDRNTELETALNKLQNTQSQLVLFEKLNALKHLVSGIAHEINSPLGAINSSREYLANSLHKVFEILPILSRWEDDPDSVLIKKMVSHSYSQKKKRAFLSYQQKKIMKEKIQEKLKQFNIDETLELRQFILELNLFDILDEMEPVLKRENSSETFSAVAAIVESYVACDNIEVAVQKASKIVFALNKYISKGSQSNADSMDKALIDIKEGIDNVLTLYENSIKFTTNLQLTCPSNLPTVEAASDELNQVWVNLTQNALDAMGSGGMLDIDIAEVNNGVEISFKDNGCGMSDDIQNRIFEPLFTTKAPGQGTGLGMDIVRKIIEENHNGKINIKSAVNIGTTVSIWLPLRQPATISSAG